MTGISVLVLIWQKTIYFLCASAARLRTATRRTGPSRKPQPRPDGFALGGGEPHQCVSPELGKVMYQQRRRQCLSGGRGGHQRREAAAVTTASIAAVRDICRATTKSRIKRRGSGRKRRRGRPEFSVEVERDARDLRRRGARGTRRNRRRAWPGSIPGHARYWRACSAAPQLTTMTALSQICRARVPFFSISERARAGEDVLGGGSKERIPPSSKPMYGTRS